VILPIALASSILGSVLPDIIEPPRNRRHRKFFHSLFCWHFCCCFWRTPIWNF